MTSLAVTAAPLRRLFERLDFAPRPLDRSLRLVLEQWQDARRNKIAPRRQDIEFSPAESASGTFFIHRHVDGKRDYGLVEGEGAAAVLLGPCKHGERPERGPRAPRGGAPASPFRRSTTGRRTGARRIRHRHARPRLRCHRARRRALVGRRQDDRRCSGRTLGPRDHDARGRRADRRNGSTTGSASLRSAPAVPSVKQLLATSRSSSPHMRKGSSRTANTRCDRSPMSAIAMSMSSIVSMATRPRAVPTSSAGCCSSSAR